MNSLYYFIFFFCFINFTHFIYCQNNNFLNQNEESILDKYLSVKYKFWNENIKGKNVKIGIFDSGWNKNNTICNKSIIKIDNFSDEIDDDLNGHGSYITSIICDDQLGISPDSNFYIYKVFDKNKNTKINWILNALDQSIIDNIDILNFSFGGINFDDKLIIEKLEQVVNHGVIIVASAGNDGPSFGSINFPGNLPFILTVGSLNKEIFEILEMSSRGPAIYKKNILINKPNTFAPGEGIKGYDNNFNITIKNGSSVSSAIVTGYLSLLISHFYNFRNFFNMGIILILIKESNINNPNINRNELTSGIFNLEGLFKITKFYLNNNKNEMKTQILNNVIDFSLDIFSNYSISSENKQNQKINFYSTMQPYYFTLIFINPISNELNKISKDFFIKNLNENFNCVDLQIMNTNNNFSKKYFYFINHIGVLQMKLQIKNEGKCHFLKEKIYMEIYFKDLNNIIGFNLIFDLIPTPSRFSRIIVSRYHNLYYPFDGFIPKDNLYDNWYNFDWTYESLETNYFSMYKSLIEFDFFIEESNLSLDCVDLSNYSVVLFIDTERQLTNSEIEILKFEFEENHLSVFIISEWNHNLIKQKFEYFDENLNQILYPITNGSEIFSLNKFMGNYGIKLGEDSISKQFFINDKILKVNFLIFFNFRLNLDVRLMNFQKEDIFLVTI